MYLLEEDLFFRVAEGTEDNRMFHAIKKSIQQAMTAMPVNQRIAIFACLAILLMLVMVRACPAAVGDWITHINSSDLSWVHFDGTGLWCASNGGAVNFDPATERFTKIVRNEPGTLVRNDLSCVAVSGEQFVWFGTLGSGLNLLNQGNWSLFTEVITLLPSNYISSLESSGNSLWAGTAHGLALFDGGSIDAVFTVANTAGGIPGDTISSISAATDTVWCATNGGVGRGIRSAGTWTWQAVNSGLASLNVLCIGRLGARVWAGTKEGASVYGTYEYDGSSWVRVGGAFAWQPQDVHGAGGKLYAAAGSSGIYAMESGTWINVTPAITASFTHLAVDTAGTLWCATSEGLLSFNGTEWREFTPPGPQYNYAEDLSIADDGRVWVATQSDQAALRFDGLEWKLYDNSTTGGAFQPRWLFSVFGSSLGTIWLGHCCFTDCRVDRLDYVDDTEVWGEDAFNNVKNIIEDPSGIVWFSADGLGSGIGIYAFDPITEVTRTFSRSPGKLASNQVEVVAPIDSRRRWVGHMLAGADYWDDLGNADPSDDVWKHFSTDQGLLSLGISSAAVIGNKTFIGTLRGVSVFEDTTLLRNYGDSDLAPASATVNDVAGDPFGNIWLATAGGVVKIASSGEVASTFTFSSSGLVNNNVLSVAVDEARGEVWFGTPQGMSVLVAWSPSEGRNLAGAFVYPNPFRPRSGDQDIRLNGLPSPVSVSVYDLSGRLVRELGTVGNNEKVWDGTDENGRAVPTGVYLLRLEAGNASSIKKVAVIR